MSGIFENVYVVNMDRIFECDGFKSLMISYKKLKWQNLPNRQLVKFQKDITTRPNFVYFKKCRSFILTP